MFVASAKRKENIAEYILYMWQVEDLIRANNLDIEAIRRHIIDPAPLDDEQRRQMTEWYESLIDMMRSENVEHIGHLQLIRNTMSQLVDLHQALLRDPEYADYSAEFYRTLPYIVELRARSGENPVGEIETCFNALYAMLLMRLRSREITPQTTDAMRQISRFIATLASYWQRYERDELFQHQRD